MLGLRFCARAFSSCGERGPLFIAVHGPLTLAASLVAEHRLQTRRLSSRGSQAQVLRSMWDLPRPRLEPVSPALAGGLSTTAPPGKPWTQLLMAKPSHFPVLHCTPPPQQASLLCWDRWLSLLLLSLLLWLSLFLQPFTFCPQLFSPQLPSPHQQLHLTLACTITCAGFTAKCVSSSLVSRNFTVVMGVLEGIEVSCVWSVYSLNPYQAIDF